MTYRKDAHISVRRNGFVGVKISKYNFVSRFVIHPNMNRNRCFIIQEQPQQI